MLQNELSIMEIYEDLNEMGYSAPLEVVAKMKPTELKRFHRKARKAFNLYFSLENSLMKLSADDFTEAE